MTRRSRILLFAALCLPSPRAAQVPPLNSVLPLTAAEWKATGATFSSGLPYGESVQLDGRSSMQLTKRFAFAGGTVRGHFKADSPYPYSAFVTVSFYGHGASLGRRDFYLEPGSSWHDFEFPVRSPPPGADEAALSIGMTDAATGHGWFAGLQFQSEVAQKLVECGRLPVFTRSAAPPKTAAGAFVRLVPTESGWWFATPDGKALFSLGSESVERLSELGLNSRVERLDRVGWGAPGTGGAAQAPLAFLALESPTAPDPYDSRYTAAYTVRAASVAQYVAAAPWLAGLFADGLFDLESLARRIWSPQATPATLAILKARYPTIGALNLAWGTNEASFQQLGVRAPDPLTASGTMGRELTAIAQNLVARYVAFTIQTIRAGDPNHLVLSPRLMVGPGLLAAIPYLGLFASYDGVAVELAPANLSAGLDRSEVQALELISRLTGRPLVISKLTLGPLPEGERARQEQAEDVLTQLYNLPYVAGVHWGELKPSPAFDATLTQLNGRLWRPEPGADVAASTPKGKPGKAEPETTDIWVSSGLQKPAVR